MPSLYTLNTQVQTLIEELDALEQHPETAVTLNTEELMADIENTLIELFSAIDKKRESYVHVIRSTTAHAKNLRDEARHLSNRAKRMENLSEYLKHRLHDDMTASGEVRADAGIFKLRIATSPARVVLEVPAELLPKAYQKVAVTANTNALRAALKDGQQIDGAVLEQGTHLRIS